MLVPLHRGFDGSAPVFFAQPFVPPPRQINGYDSSSLLGLREKSSADTHQNLCAEVLARSLFSTVFSVAVACTTLTWSTMLFAADATEEVESAAGGEDGEQDSGTLKATPSEQQRTLAERIPSVTRRAFEKAGRLEIFPTVGVSLNDPFFNHVISSVGLSFHVLESLAIGVTGDFFLSLQSRVPVSVEVQQPDFNRPVYAGRLEVAWSPLYGKMSVLAETVLHLDTYVVAGAGIVAPQKGAPSMAAVVGLGQHYFVNDWLALRIEVRDQIFTMSRTKVGAAKDKSLQTLLSATVGVCFYVPPDFEREAL